MINVNIRDRQCAMPECSKYPSCNFPGSTDGLYCGAWLLSPGIRNRWPRNLCRNKKSCFAALTLRRCQCMCSSSMALLGCLIKLSLWLLQE